MIRQSTLRLSSKTLDFSARWRYGPKLIRVPIPLRVLGSHGYNRFVYTKISYDWMI